MSRFLFSLGLAVFLFASASGMLVDDTNEPPVASEVGEETSGVEVLGVAVFESEEIFTETREEYGALPGIIREILVSYTYLRRPSRIQQRATQVDRSWSWYGEQHQFFLG